MKIGSRYINNKVKPLIIAEIGINHQGSFQLAKRLIKPLYYFTIAICICFLLVFAKEKTKYKFYRLNIFLFGFIILVISEISTSLAGESFFSLYATIFLPILIFLISIILLNYKFLKY